MNAQTLTPIPALRSRSMALGVLAPLHVLLAALLMGFARREGAHLEWGRAGVATALFIMIALAARLTDRRWVLLGPLLAAMPPFFITPTPAAAWALYAAVSAAATVTVRPSLWYAVFLAAVPWIDSGVIFLFDPRTKLAVAPMLLVSGNAAIVFHWTSRALHRQNAGESAESNAWLLRMREREPIDAELRESLGAVIMGVAAESRLAAAGDDAALREHLASADGIARRGLERLRATSRALRSEEVESDAVAGLLRTALRGLAGERIEFAMHCEGESHLLPAEIAYGMVALVFDMLEAARAFSGGAILNVYCGVTGYTLQLRLPLPEVAYAQTREWTVLRKRAARMGAQMTSQSEGGRLTLLLSGRWPNDR